MLSVSVVSVRMHKEWDEFWRMWQNSGRLPRGGGIYWVGGWVKGSHRMKSWAKHKQSQRQSSPMCVWWTVYCCGMRLEWGGRVGKEKEKIFKKKK